MGLAADFVQDLYLRELKSYKPTPVKANDADGHVQVFNMPKAPQSPEEADIANELKAYEDSAVEIEGQDVEAGASGTAAVEQEWFVEEEDDEAGAHH